MVETGLAVTELQLIDAYSKVCYKRTDHHRHFPYANSLHYPSNGAR